MPQDYLADAQRMAEAFVLVAAGAVPVGLVAAAVSRRLGQPIIPRWQRPATPWGVFDILLLFLLSFLMPSLFVAGLSQSGALNPLYGPEFPAFPMQEPASEAAAVVGEASLNGAQTTVAATRQVYGLWARTLSLPILFGAAGVLVFLSHRRLPMLAVAQVPGQIAFGVLGWLLLTPLVFGVFSASVLLLEQLGDTTEVHPTVQLSDTGGLLGWIVMGVSVGVVAPLDEEFLFRGLLVGWATRRRMAAWSLILVVAALTVGQLMLGRWGPGIFGTILWAGFCVMAFSRHRRLSGRVASAIFASAALFAMMHRSVWPTPIPLFVLGLGLGYLAARTNGIVAGVVVHGLFNAISFVFLLRGGGAH